MPDVTPPATDITGIEIGGVRLEPTSPSLAAAAGIIRTLVASIGLIVAVWRYVSAGQLIAAYQFVTSPTNSGAVVGFLGAVAAAGCMGWGAWKKWRGKTTENTLKAAVVTSTLTQAPIIAPLPADPAATIAAGGGHGSMTG